MRFTETFSRHNKVTDLFDIQGRKNSGPTDFENLKQARVS
jgi:uncharacterized protein YdcH (DUF465 family)